MCTSLFAGSIPVGSTIFDKHIVSERIYERKAYSCKTRRIHCGSSWSWREKWWRLQWRWRRGMFGVDRHYICDLVYRKFLGNNSRGSHFVCCGLADLDFSSSHLVRHMLDFFKTRELDLCRIQGTAVILVPEKVLAASRSIFQQVC